MHMATSVTIFGEILSLWQNYAILLQVADGLGI